MRKAINENPIVQIGLLGVLGVLAAVVFMSSMGGGSAPPAEEATPAETSASTDPAAPTDAAAAADPAAAAPADAVVPADPATPAPETVPGEPAASTPFEAGKGLPAGVVDAHESSDVVVLLVMQNGGVEDEALEREVAGLEGRGDTSVFVTDAKNVSRYSRIAEGVTLDRVPAIIVLHPLESKLAGGEAPPMPDASVAYGYRGPESVVQAVNDALYEGKSGPYSP
ncbi:MAG: hypothetical protein M3Y34_02325 [Actinomycetota bacterium]|nr:hypothetical protein [Actinomycetota bacterium]